MKRRKVVFGSAAAVAAPAIGKFSIAAQAAGAADPNRLNGELMPLGGERAASKSGLVPAWTGGANTPPPGWSAGALPPDLFGDEKPIFSVTQANMAQYSDMLSAGQILMFNRFGSAGFRLDVYPSHRTVCAPQYVYDNTYKNVGRAQPGPGGLKYGVSGAINGPPFPILSDDPKVAGAQAIWNHQIQWKGQFYNFNITNYVVGAGQRVVTSSAYFQGWDPYYDPNLTPDQVTSYYDISVLLYTAPPNQAGGKFLANQTLNELQHPATAYEYLIGEGRIREAPATVYDIPTTQFGDAVNYDESYLFLGPLDRYDWNLVGKKEMIVPYNLYKAYMAQPSEFLGLQFPNPDLIRYEVHRCWVVEAHLAPGKRHSMPFRRFYIDEDSWHILLSDGYDGQGNYWRYGNNYNLVCPDLPGTISPGWFLIQNFQTAEYITTFPFFKAPVPEGGGLSFQPVPRSELNPQALANSGGL